MSIFDTVTGKGKKFIDSKYGVDTPDMSEKVIDCLFSIYDTVCEEYNPPFVSKNMKTAIRSIKESLKGRESLISLHPEDYLLVLIGTFDKDTGCLGPIESRQVYNIERLFEIIKENEKVGKVSDVSEVIVDEVSHK